MTQFLIYIDTNTKQFCITEINVPGEWKFDTEKDVEFHFNRSLLNDRM